MYTFKYDGRVPRRGGVVHVHSIQTPVSDSFYFQHDYWACGRNGWDIGVYVPLDQPITCKNCLSWLAKMGASGERV